MIYPKIITVLFIVFCFTNNAMFTQIRLDDWKAHTSLVYTQNLDIDNKGKIWAATSGGLYSVNSSGNELKVFRNIDEMLDIDITVVKYNNETNELFIGSRNGYIDILDNEGEWHHITDIVGQKFSNPKINDIRFNDGKAYIAGDFGLTVFDVNKRVFDETIRRFGDFNTNLPANKILIDNNSIWVATTTGVAKANIGTTLSNPANWISYPAMPGLFEQSINDIAIHNGVLYSMSDKFITKLVNGKFEEYRTTLDKFTSIFSTLRYGLVTTTLYGLLDSNFSPIQMEHPEIVYGATYYEKNDDKFFVVKYNNNGIGIFKNNIFTNFIPNTPLSNVSTDMGVDNSGNLWIATDEDPNGRGISRFDGLNWLNFTVKDYPEMKSNNYHRISVSGDGRIAASNFGYGLLVIEPESDNFKLTNYNRTNSKLYGLGEAPDYIVCGKPRFDRIGNIWVPILGNESSGPALVAFDRDYTSYGFVNTRNPVQRYFSSLAIDGSGTKWIGGSVVRGLGMLYYNEKGALDNSAGNYSGFITQNDYTNMPDNTHSCIEVDMNGFVWIGTPRGLAVISNPSAVTQSNPVINIRNLNRLIGEQNINYIMVDAQNNKWLATNNGIIVINSDGSDTLGIINKNNSFLPTNEILSLATNKITGQVYFGTKLGIYEAKSLFLEPANEYDIKCFPQPFKPSVDKEMIIEGLEEFTDIRIVTLSGLLVNQIFANSKKIIWNGRDTYGNYARPGIYLVLATSATSKHSSVQKIAVIE